VCGCDEVEVLARCPQVRKKLWGGEFWSDGYFLSTVGQHGSEETIHNYVKGHVKGQGQPGQYQQLHAQQPTLSLFDASPLTEKLHSIQISRPLVAEILYHRTLILRGGRLLFLLC
jgi:hypothetical protein